MIASQNKAILQSDGDSLGVISLFALFLGRIRGNR